MFSVQDKEHMDQFIRYPVTQLTSCCDVKSSSGQQGKSSYGDFSTGKEHLRSLITTSIDFRWKFEHNWG